MNDSQQFVPDIARALGLDPHGIIEINLRFRAGDLLVVDAQQLVRGDRLKKVADEIVNRKFVFREIEDDGAPVAVPADQPPKPSGVNFAFALAADVARCVAQIEKERHDAAMCRGERQEPDVGEGWRELGADEILKAGDECDIGVNEPRWVVTQRAGRRVSENTDGDRYRRRVTPDPKSQTPDAGGAWADIRRKAYGVAAQANAMLADALQKAASDAELLKAENTALRSEMERLRLEPSVQEEIVAWSVDLHDAREKIKRLEAEVERLRLTPNQMELEGNE